MLRGGTRAPRGLARTECGLHPLSAADLKILQPPLAGAAAGLEPLEDFADQVD
jgi:hypothetical protein